MKLQENTRNKAVCTVLCAALVFLALCWCDQKDFYYDSGGYWQLGQSFWQDGVFSLQNYPAYIDGYPNIRGYLFPLILGILQRGANPYLLFRLFYSGIAACLLCVLLPAVFGMKREFYGKKRYGISCCFLLLAVFYFWKDLIRFPLSDLPALALYACSICLSLRILKEERLWKTVLHSLLLGLTVYASYNIRTVYLIPSAVLLVVVLLALLCKKRYRSLVIVACGCAIAAALLSIPQVIINRNGYGIISPMVQTTSSGKSNLFVAQLEGGIRYARYETYVGDLAVFPTPGVNFASSGGMAVLSGSTISSIRGYILWVLRHLLFAAGLYWEHFISAITMFYTQVYLTDIRIDVFAFLLNCGIWLLAFIGLTAQVSVSGIREPDRLMPVAFFLFPAVLALPGAVETRFIFPAYLLIYGFLAMQMDYKAAWGFCRRRPFVMGSLALLILLTWCMAANSLLGNILVGELTLTGQYIPGG